jgi:predicted DCC family thiol-disulfide oxidoreductase YuxK
MSEHSPIILFDGVCNYCNTMVNFVIKEDKQKTIKFSPLQSTTGQVLLNKYHVPKNIDSFVFIENGKAHLQSTAALKVIKHLAWYWQWLQALWLIPKFLRDRVYNFVAKRRYKWFGKKESCMIPTPEIRSRFLD